MSLICEDSEDTLCIESLTLIESSPISRRCVKILRDLLMRGVPRPASSDLWRALASLYKKMSVLAPFISYLDRPDDLRLYRCCWFFVNVLCAKYTLVETVKTSWDFNDHVRDVFYDSLVVLSKVASSKYRGLFCWTSETYWLMFYIEEVTLVPFFADIFSTYKGQRYVTSVLLRNLKSVDYEIDLYCDDMILVIIIKNLVDADPKNAFDSRIVPTLLKYLRKNRIYISDCLSTMDCQKSVLLNILTIVFNLAINVDRGLHQLLYYDGVESMTEFIGSHPEIDVVIYRHVVLLQRWIENRTKERILDQIKEKETSADSTAVAL